MKRYNSLFAILTFLSILLVGCGTKSLTPDRKFTAPDNSAFYQPSITGVEEVEDTEYVGGDRRPMVMINGELYYDTGRESDISGRCGVMDGKILTTVDSTEILLEDNQSNFGSDFDYQFVNESSIDIVINEKWIRFEKETKENTESIKNSETDAWGIELTATNVTPTGMTLICNQLGGQPTGDLQTGSPYWLEIKINDQWTLVETVKTEYDIAWTSEAWMIAKNGSTEWNVNWEWLYGELSAGSYRIWKEIMDFRASGDYDTNAYYAYFEVE